MVKKISSFIFIVIILLSLTTVYAEKDTNKVTPMYIPCDYWEGPHRLHEGRSWVDHDFQYQHKHYTYDEYGGIIGEYFDWVCKKYRVTEKYCACGYTEKSSYYIGTHCH
ncbi:hypothetical protein SAMN02745135_02251 [Caloranaerobacter azorensis DSM 13643]|uniref:Uncharacterized protein n=1 Tax=Caloranaerobacter azorensis DSM 13643 TaxID=1121264 RepID=A0A1M5W1Q4_9FIRM|nr:hypothetical protein [Caloranaerobacter azorensis]SHH81509.1 hypothetical protein SAMN02745135_02251 [Caloranaerobacter azorensis DSM 13643]